MSSTQISALQRHLLRVVQGSTREFQEHGHDVVQPDNLGHHHTQGPRDPPHPDAMRRQGLLRPLRGGGDGDGEQRRRDGGGIRYHMAAEGNPLIPEDLGSGSCGAYVGGARVPRLRQHEMPDIPGHVRLGVRRAPALPNCKRDVVSCKHCGAVGARLRLAQFLRKHAECRGVLDDAEPLFSPPTVWEASKQASKAAQGIGQSSPSCPSQQMETTGAGT